MASSMSPELQKTFENTWAYEMNQQLKEMFQAKASKECLDVVKSLMACKPKPGAFICAVILEMKGLNLRLQLQVIQRKQCDSTATQRGHWKRTFLKYLKDLKDGKVKRVVTQDGYKFSFDNENGDILVYSNGCFMFKASPCKGIYETVKCISHNGNVILNVGSSNELDKSKLWHSRLGHVNKKRIAQLQKDGVLESFDFKLDDVCESCLLGKMTKSPFTGSCERGEGLLDLVHTDVCGPFRSATKDGKRYYVTFTDDFSRYGYVYLIKHKSDTFEVFKSYPEESFGYLFYKPKDNVVFVARRGVFLEREMISKENSGSKIDLEEIQESADEEPIVNTPDPHATKRGGAHMSNSLMDKISDSTLSELDEPVDYKEAMANPEAAKWKEAMKSEIQSMYDNLVWILVNTTPSLKMVGCKWIFKKKIDMDGKLHTYKARIMLAIAAFHDYEIWQMDVKTAFLNRKLIEDVFMAQPGGFENAKYPKRVCKLQNAIYGLKQASHSWNLYFHEKVFLLNGGAMTWKSSKQDTVADSTSESGYIVACEASKKAIWVKNFIGDLGVILTIQDLIEILCDNESAVALTKEPKDHGKSKHIERKYHFVRKK
ncbi:retrotransposon protein, putative, ty1-copia subclass [Tanacetum coccineum]